MKIRIKDEIQADFTVKLWNKQMNLSTGVECEINIELKNIEIKHYFNKNSKAWEVTGDSTGNTEVKIIAESVERSAVIESMVL